MSDFLHVSTHGRQAQHRRYHAPVLVARIEGDKLAVEGSHPFAGKSLICTVTGVDSRNGGGGKRRSGITRVLLH